MTSSSIDVRSLDPYAFMAVIGKRVIHPGGRRSTDELLRRAEVQPGERVLDVGCGVGTTAIAVAHRYGAAVDAVDLAPLMLERAEANVRAAGAGDRVSVREGDILGLPYDDDTFDCVIAEAVTMFVDRERAARELMRVCRPGGRVLATEFFWRRPPSDEAREIFLGEVCPGMEFDTREDWVRIYERAGMDAIESVTGPFEMMTPRGFIQDEGVRNSGAVMLRCLSRWSYLRKMAWLFPRIRRAVPFLGFILVSGRKPASGQR